MSTRSVLDEELQQIRSGVIRLCGMVKQATNQAFDAFAQQDMDIAQQVIDNDDQLDNLHHALEEQIIKTIALQQPMASDLRNLVAALLIITELERMGDHAEGIAKTVFRHSDDDALDVPPPLTSMRQRVSEMMDAVTEAYRDEAPQKARTAARMDDKLDVLYRELFELLIERMTHNELVSELGTYMLWAGHNLERIGDRVTNICERIFYARTGQISGMNPKERD